MPRSETNSASEDCQPQLWAVDRPQVAQSELSSTKLADSSYPLGRYGRFTSALPKQGKAGTLSAVESTPKPSPLELVSSDIKYLDIARANGRLVRFALQAGARELLPDQKGIQGCLRWRRAGASCIQVMYKPLTRSARFGGLQTCGSVWCCAVCAAKIADARCRELGKAVRNWWAQGGIVVMVSYTVRHKMSDQLDRILDGLMQARGIATSGRRSKQLRESCGVVGSVRALEVTYGENGYHPHVHEILFIKPCSGDVGQVIAPLWPGLRSLWSAAVTAVGMEAVNNHGVDITVAREEIEEYITKQGLQSTWGVEHELTKSATKMGKAKGKTPMQLLSEFTFEGNIESGRLFSEYARCFKGRRQLYWSKGLRDLLKMGREISDQEIVQDVDPVEELFAQISLFDWHRILKVDARAKLLNVAALGDQVYFETYLSNLLSGFPPYQSVGLELDHVRNGQQSEAAAVPNMGESSTQEGGEHHASLGNSLPAAGRRKPGDVGS